MPVTDIIERDNNLFARQYNYDTTTIFAIDTTPQTTPTAVDIIDGTAILVFDTEDGDQQREMELPDGDATAFINNGIVTIEVKE